MREQNYTLDRIAARVGHPPQSCQTKAYELGLYKRPPIAVFGAIVADKTRRPCLRCRELFRSEGPHNRMCPKCRTVSVSPFEP